jgi:hypothetical protein
MYIYFLKFLNHKLQTNIQGELPLTICESIKWNDMKSKDMLSDLVDLSRRHTIEKEMPQFMSKWTGKKHVIRLIAKVKYIYKQRIMSATARSVTKVST